MEVAGAEAGVDAVVGGAEDGGEEVRFGCYLLVVSMIAFRAICEE